MRWRALRAAFPYTLPVLTGYLFLGFAYGILMHSAGLPAWMTVLCSTVIYAGSMQYALVPLLTGPFSPAGAFVLTLMVNARHLFYGLSMLAPYRRAGALEPYLAFALTDETFSVHVAARAPAGTDEKWFLFFVSALDQFYWVAASALGALAGGVLRFDAEGISFVMTALFVAIVTGQWLDSSEHRPALIGFGASALCLAVFGASFIVPAMVLITVLLAALRPVLEKEDAPCK